MDRALERLGPTPDILERLATYWVTAGVPERPLAALTETLETTDPTPEERAVLLHLRGAVQARAAEHEPRGIVAAVADLEQALALGRSEVREDLVAVLERQLQLADTLADESQERLTLLRLAREFHDVVGPTQLLALLGNWVARHPKDSVIALLQVEQASLAGDHETAAHAALQLFHSSETDVQKRAALLYADACSAFGEPRAAHGVLEEMCRTYPSDKELAAKLRSLYEASNSFEALADLMLREVPEDATQAERHQATLAAAQILQRESPLPARTIDLFEAALALAPEDHATTLGLANACTEGGRIQQACAILETAIKAQGKRRTRELSDLQQAMSRVARIAGDDEGRLAWLDAALQTDRRNGDVAAELAIFAMDREDFETALKALQLITLLKEDCAMSRAEAYLRQAIIAQKKDDPKKGILLARRALATDPGYAAAKEFLAERGQNT
jgi:thioredoxin-like negative regulator of GroEL